MAKSKEQKRAEALERLNARIADRIAVGQKPTFDQRMEHNALSYPKRVKTDSEKMMEKLFGPSDPVTGTIYANPLPLDFRPTPELNRIVDHLKTSTERFVEVQVDLNTPEGYRYGTYEGSGDYFSQWIARHTSYRMHHTKHLYGDHITVVFSHENEIPFHDEDNSLISGTTQEMYERRRYA